MRPWLLNNQIESRRDGLVKLEAMRNAELWGRCRLKLLSNPTSPIEERMQKCTALKMCDRKLIARFAFSVFTYGISAEERYNDTVQKITEKEE